MGIATLLGLGVLQMNGLQAVFGINNSIGTQMIIIVIMFAAYTGLDKGIRYLSNFNLGFALGLLVFVFITGPTLFILGTFTLALGDYLSNFIQYSLRLQSYVGGTWVSFIGRGRLRGRRMSVHSLLALRKAERFVNIYSV